MKIIKFTAENIKRLRAVEITPDGTVQVITGKNAAGKSSVLDAIWLALGGGTASKSTAKPIRAGQDNAHVRLDLGDLVVTRTWAGDKTTLKVESQDGAKYSSPQGVLDSLVGRLSFDALLDIVDIGVDLCRGCHRGRAGVGMIALIRVESWRDGVLVAARTVPNANVAKVYVAQQESRGFRVLLVHPRTETERAS
jgi:hypothetical protein